MVPTAEQADQRTAEAAVVAGAVVRQMASGQSGEDGRREQDKQ